MKWYYLLLALTTPSNFQLLGALPLLPVSLEAIVCYCSLKTELLCPLHLPCPRRGQTCQQKTTLKDLILRHAQGPVRYDAIVNVVQLQS